MRGTIYGNLIESPITVSAQEMGVCVGGGRGGGGRVLHGVHWVLRGGTGAEMHGRACNWDFFTSRVICTRHCESPSHPLLTPGYLCILTPLSRLVMNYLQIA